MLEWKCLRIRKEQMLLINNEQRKDDVRWKEGCKLGKQEGDRRYGMR